MAKMASSVSGKASTAHNYQERPSEFLSTIGRRLQEHSNFTTTAEYEAYNKNPQNRKDRPVNLTSRMVPSGKYAPKLPLSHRLRQPYQSLKITPKRDDFPQISYPRIERISGKL